MISNTAHFIDADALPVRERPQASMDVLLSLAAAPTFAVMALLTAVHGGGMPDMLCSAAGSKLPLSGMFLMYVLMSTFHLGPWLRLLRSSGTTRYFASRPLSTKSRWALK
jgi:hypothetical protein